MAATAVAGEEAVAAAWEEARATPTAVAAMATPTVAVAMATPTVVVAWAAEAMAAATHREWVAAAVVAARWTRSAARRPLLLRPEVGLGVAGNPEAVVAKACRPGCRA